jgi:hypothetical protein
MKLQPGRSIAGPSLRGLWGRSATGLDGRADANKEVSAVWSGLDVRKYFGVPAGRSVFLLTSLFIGLTTDSCPQRRQRVNYARTDGPDVPACVQRGLDEALPSNQYRPIHGFCTVPDPALTPGEMDPALACVPNGDRPREVTDSEKNAILAAYGYPASTKESSGEFDHWLPHWMGGSDGPKNIWFEPHAGKFGSFTKDKVELMLWRAVCVKKTMTLDQAKRRYLQGWTKLVAKR